ncbi:hypothetical protein TSMEX_009855 [Taenia solium]|eukprot:TsM_000567300 transcript=TsM_000567300 gene=TsM_000567300
MGQHVSHSKGAITTRAVLDMCNSLTRTEVLEIAFKLIKDTGASNAAMLWSSMNVDANRIPQAMPMSHLMEAKPSLRCGCWKCHERTVNEFEAGTGVQEVIAYLDYILDEFTCYFFQTRKLYGDESTLISERERISSSLLSLSSDDDCIPSSVACTSIDSPPCVDDELMSDYAIQENIKDQGSVLLSTRNMHELYTDTEIAFRQNFFPNSLVEPTLSW